VAQLRHAPVLGRHRARERGLDKWQSFWFSALLSTLWEFGAEAVAEPVSIQDMIVTPVLGSLVGEYLFSPWRAHIRAKPGPLSFSDKTVLVLTDPLGTVKPPGPLVRGQGVSSSAAHRRASARATPGVHATRACAKDSHRLASAIADGVVARTTGLADDRSRHGVLRISKRDVRERLGPSGYNRPGSAGIALPRLSLRLVSRSRIQ
jgi:hypothetical protein